MKDLGYAIEALLARAFPEFLAPSWRAWLVQLYVLCGRWDLVDEAGRALFQQCTGLSEPPDTIREMWLVIGRRGGKSRFCAALAVIVACVKDYRGVLVPGERGIVALIAADRRQARVLKRYILALLRGVPVFEHLIRNTTADAIELSNGITISIQTASFKTIRGHTIVAAFCDEIAFWSTGEESANPDAEILTALRPAMATVPGALLFCLSSPYARRGELWRTYDRHYGKPGPVLVWQADTRTMNPSVDESIIDTAYLDDPIAAAAEYGAEFRRDVERFVSHEVLAVVTVPERGELGPQPDVRYVAFVDPSGGASDAMTLAIGHRERAGRGVLDAVAEVKAPFSPATAVDSFVQVLRRYRITSVTGDRYAGEWPADSFRKHGVSYRTADANKSELYTAFLPQLTSATCELLDHPRLRGQLLGLERRTTRNGRDVVDHAPRQHDDLANAVAGVMVAVGKASNLRAGFARLSDLRGE